MEPFGRRNLTPTECQRVQEQMRQTPWTRWEREEPRYRKTKVSDRVKFYSNWEERIGVHPAILFDRVARAWPQPIPGGRNGFAKMLRGDYVAGEPFLRATLQQLATTPEELLEVGGAAAAPSRR